MVQDQDVLSTSTTLKHDLGALGITTDGRKFRYCKAGGTALVAGKLQQSPVEITNHQDLTPTAARAIGDTTVTVTLGATAATLNQYSNGWLVATTSTGAGFQYKIKSHPAADSLATLVVTLDDPFIVATATTTRFDLVLNPFNGVVVNPTTATSGPVGVAVYNIGASEFGWIQTNGPAVILSDAGSTVGTNVSASNATAGAVEASVTAQAAIGYALTGVATTEYGMFYVTID